MLRLLVLALLLANAGYFAWTQGLLADYGLAPAAQSEPQRLAQQIRPEAMQLLTPNEAGQPHEIAPAAAMLTPAAECLQAGPFSDEQARTLRPRLQSSLPAGRWSLEDGLAPVRWIIYMGRYASEDALAKKRNELRLRGVSMEPLLNPALNPGLSLGHFSSQAEADSALVKIAQHGVRSARVVMEQPELRGQWLRLTPVDAALLAKLEALKPQLDAKALQPCR